RALHRSQVQVLSQPCASPWVGLWLDRLGCRILLVQECPCHWVCLQPLPRQQGVDFQNYLFLSLASCRFHFHQEERVACRPCRRTMSRLGLSPFCMSAMILLAGRRTCVLLLVSSINCSVTGNSRSTSRNSI